MTNLLARLNVQWWESLKSWAVTSLFLCVFHYSHYGRTPWPPRFYFLCCLANVYHDRIPMVFFFFFLLRAGQPAGFIFIEHKVACFTYFNVVKPLSPINDFRKSTNSEFMHYWHFIYHSVRCIMNKSIPFCTKYVTVQSIINRGNRHRNWPIIIVKIYTTYSF